MLLTPGTLVTAAEAPIGSPEWLGLMHTATGFFELGYPPDFNLASRGQRYSGPKRPITDNEAVGLVDALTWERWHEDAKGTLRLVFGWGRLVVHPGGGWEVWLNSNAQLPAAVGVGGKATACRGLLRWFCWTGGTASGLSGVSR